MIERMSGFPFLALLLLAAIGVQADSKHRLPQDVKPSRYEITLEPDLEKFTFNGSAVITINVLKKVDTITLNQKNLTLTKNDVSLINNKTNIVYSVEKDDNFELLIIRLTEGLEKGEHKLTIKYTGVLNDKKRGFYRSRYLDKDNKIKYIATTHFEPTGARLAFPCWDEPEYKAVFKIILKHLPKYTAVISNMEFDNAVTDPKTNVTSTSFKDSKPMSSYLVAFVVSDYVKNENKDKTFRVFTKPHALSQTTYALDFGEKVISKLDNYTGIKYLTMIPKMDQISIKDFSAGAMENWGLVTYRETALLYEENVTTTRSKQSIATVIAHEFAHQWFGDLVSPKWWEYIWLNEGFANYFQYFITNQLEESWRLMEVFAVEALQGTAFAADARENTRPMNKAVVTPNEISALFDSIAYQKAGSVIRMMSSILTEKVFQERIKAYLKKYQYQIAESKNLIDSLQGDGKDTYEGEKFETIMDEWINQPGYPVVTVKKANKGVELSQERFMLYGPSDSTKWWIPITYVLQSNDPKFTNITPSLWLSKNKNLTIPDVTDDKWIIVNTQQTGYYRVNYDVKNWELLQKYLLTKDYNKIHAVNRAQLIDDALAMARTNRLDYTVALSLTLYLHQETDYIPWITANRHLNFFQNMLYTSKHYNMYKSYVKYILEAVVKTVKYAPQPNDEHTTKMHRANVMKWACKAEEKECVKYAEKEFEAWLNAPGTYKLNADLKSNILCYGLRSADEKKWEKTKDELSKTTADEDELNTVLAVMGCSKSPSILKKLLEQSLQQNSTIDFDVAVQSVLTNNPKEGFDLVLNMISDNYGAIKQLKNPEDQIKSCIDSLANLVVTPDQFLRLSMLNTKVGAKADTVQSTVEKSTRNINWFDQHGEKIGKWLIKNEQLFHSAGSTIVLTSFLLVLSFLFTRFY